MIRYQSHFEECKALLRTLRSGARVAFAAACAERQMPIYEGYSYRTGRGNSQILASMLTKIWSDLPDEKLPIYELRKMLGRCHELLPDPGRVEDAYQANAECTGMCVAYTIRTRLSGESSDAIWAATQAVDSLWNFLTSAVMRRPLIDISQPSGREMVNAHPTVQAEYQRQQEDLKELTAAAEGFSKEHVQDLRFRARAAANGFLGN